MCSCFTCYYTCHRAWMNSTSLGLIFGPLHTRHNVVHQDRDHFGPAHTSVAVQVTCCTLTSLKNFANKRRFTDKSYIGNYKKQVLNKFQTGISFAATWPGAVIYRFCACLCVPLQLNDVMYQHPVASKWTTTHS